MMRSFIECTSPCEKPPCGGRLWVQLGLGTVNLIGSGRDKAHEGRSRERLCPSSHAGDLGPGLEGLGPGGSILAGGAGVAAGGGQVGGLLGGREGGAGRGSRLGPPHPSPS